MLAFGTSLTWGDGLKQECTYRYLVAGEISERTHRSVELWTFAHSAAYLTDAADAGALALSARPSKGDLNGSIASVSSAGTTSNDGQAECALSSIGSLQDADLIVLDGCVNEVNAVLIVAPWTPSSKIVDDTRVFCGRMKEVLDKLEAQFPKAIIVVVNYYPIVSDKSNVFGHTGTHRLAGFATKQYRSQRAGQIQAYKKQKLSQVEEKNIMADNSEVFYQTSKQVLSDAINAANPIAAPRVFAATLPEPSTDPDGHSTVDPNWAYGAPKTHLWLLPLPLFFGLALNPDEKFAERWWLCLSSYSLLISIAS